jgi:hypothetical protein
MNNMQNKPLFYNPRDDFVDENSEIDKVSRPPSHNHKKGNIMEFMNEKVEIDFPELDRHFSGAKNTTDLAEDFKDISTGDDPYMFNNGQV